MKKLFVVAVFGALGTVLGASVSHAAPPVDSATSSPDNAGDYSCVSTGAGFPAGALFQLRADFPSTADNDDDVNAGEMVDYSFLWENAVAFNGDWTVSVLLPDGTTSTVGPVNVTTPATPVVTFPGYVVQGTTVGTVQSASIASVEVTNTGNGVTITCTAAGTPSGVDLYVNEPPVPQNDGALTIENEAVTVDVIQNDGITEDSGTSDGPVQAGAGQDDQAALGPPVVTVQAADGTCAPAGGDSITYTPDPLFVGTDSCTYEITDNDGATGQATVNIDVVAFDVDITPQSATNTVTDPHEFTIAARVDDGSAVRPLTVPPNSGTVDWAFEAPDGSTSTGTCTLAGNGVCAVVQNSAVSGVGTLTATSLTATYSGQSLGPIDLTTTSNGQSPGLTIPPQATKEWNTFVPVTPFRLEDTRSGAKVGSADGSAAPLQFNVLNRGGLPASGVDAVSLNITVDRGEQPDLGGGYVTVYDCGPRPTASNINFANPKPIANAVITPVSPTGDVCVYVYGTADIIVDINGYFPDVSGFDPVTPFRLEDTRSGAKVGSADGSAAPLQFNVLNRGGLPASGVDAVSLNITVDRGEQPDLGGGYVTVYDCGPRPTASNINFANPKPIANAVITPVSPTGDVCVYVYGTADIIVDINGYFPDVSGFDPVTPFRLEDTRSGAKVGSADGSAAPLQFNVLNRGGLPASGVDAVSLNITVDRGEQPDLGGGYVTVYDCGPRPTASNINFANPKPIANAVITPVSPTGDVCVYVYGTADIIVDINGYFPP